MTQTNKPEPIPSDTPIIDSGITKTTATFKVGTEGLTLLDSEIFCKPLHPGATLTVLKRSRRPKGTSPGVMVETIKYAYIDLFIPERPVGFDEVFMRFHTSLGVVTILWPEGQSELKAIVEHLPNV